MCGPWAGWLPIALFQLIVVICNLSAGLGVFRKVKLANRSSSPYLWELRQVSFEHPTWTVQKLTQEAHSVSVVPAVSNGSVLVGKGWRGDQM